MLNDANFVNIFAQAHVQSRCDWPQNSTQTRVCTAIFFVRTFKRLCARTHTAQRKHWLKGIPVSLILQNFETALPDAV